MKQIKIQLARCLIMLAVMLPWATTEALETFEQTGVITALGYDKFTVNNTQYRVSPGAKFDGRESGYRKFSDFKQGDLILFKGKVLNGVNYVDIIVYMTPFIS